MPLTGHFRGRDRVSGLKKLTFRFIEFMVSSVGTWQSSKDRSLFLQLLVVVSFCWSLQVCVLSVCVCPGRWSPCPQAKQLWVLDGCYS